MDDREITVWQETTGVRGAVTVAPSMLPSASLRAADPTDLIPASDAEVLLEITPCLQLVAAVGMGEDEQDTWFEAALKALAGIPLGLIQRGAAAAMRKADHHSKIVPAIMAEIGEDWAWRRRFAHPVPIHGALPAPAEAVCTPEEASELIRKHMPNFGRHASRAPERPTEIKGGDRQPGRTPTREDYIRLGVDPAVLDGASV